MRDWIEAGGLMLLAGAGVALATFTFFGGYWYQLLRKDDDNA